MVGLAQLINVSLICVGDGWTFMNKSAQLKLRREKEMKMSEWNRKRARAEEK